MQARACINYVEDDTSFVGGGIDTNEVVASAYVPNIGPTVDVIVRSTSASDTTQSFYTRWRITGPGGGSWKSNFLSQVTLNGTTNVDLDAAGSQILTYGRALLSATCVGNVEIHEYAIGAVDQGAIITIPAGLLRARGLFNVCDDSGGGLRYDKTFWRNGHASLTMVNPAYRFTLDPLSKLRIGIHTSKNDTATTTNRKTAPAGVTFVGINVDQSGSDLASGDNQGIWWELTTAGAPYTQSSNAAVTAQMAAQSI